MPNSPIAAGDLFSPNTRPWIGGCTFATSLRESTFAGEIMPKTSVWASHCAYYREARPYQHRAPRANGTGKFGARML
jgi:hypothetical protein